MGLDRVLLGVCEAGDNSGSGVKIKILHVIATLDPAGAESQLTRLVLNLDPERFSSLVCCLTRGGPLEERLSRGGIPVHVLHKRGKLDLVALFRLARIVRQFAPHLVHTWMFTSNAYGRTAALLARSPIRVATELSVDEWKWGPYRLADRLLLPFTDAVIVNAEAVRRLYTMRWRVPESKMVLIRNGIDLSIFLPGDKRAARARFGLPQQALVIGGAGRLDPQKGFSILLEATSEVLGKHPEAVVAIAGEGPEHGPLREQIARLGLGDHARLLGHVQDMAGFMSAMDVFALPSLWEGLPHVVMEAMACERPVVAARVGGVEELVQDSATGIVVQPRSSKALAAALIRLLDESQVRLDMGRKGRAVAEREFDFKKMVRQTEELYLSLIERHGLCAKS